MKRNLYFILLLFAGVSVFLSACGVSDSRSDSKASSELIIKEEADPPTVWPEELPSPTSSEPDAQMDQILEEGIEEIEGLEESINIFGSVVSPDPEESIDESVPESLRAVPAASMVKVITANSATLAACFYAEEISPEVYSRMEYNSFSEECTVPLDNLRYVRVLHYGFDGEIYIGELVVNRLIAQDIIDIFKELFDAKYPIERMVLIDDYQADDLASMAANNSSCFNFRQIEGTSQLSKHALGLALDINPKYNPQVKETDGKTVTLPEEAIEYADRSEDCLYYIKKEDVCYQAFVSRGFTWGGDWEKNKDYQHFQKVFP